MRETPESNRDNPLSRHSADRPGMRLECIGSFKALTQDGEAYTVDIWTHFGAKHDRDRERVSPTLLVLTTTDGRGVDRIAQGQYRLTEQPEISLSTDNPNAP